jgi:hypothetical protein
LRRRRHRRPQKNFVIPSVAEESLFPPAVASPFCDRCCFYRLRPITAKMRAAPPLLSDISGEINTQKQAQKRRHNGGLKN